MTKTTAEHLTGLELLRDMLKRAREQSYHSGTPIIMMVPDLHSADQIISMLDLTAYDIKKYQQVEREVLEYDRVLKIAAHGKGAVGREPDGRDYNELFAILSIAQPKEKA